jgi:hypothetical protein
MLRTSRMRWRGEAWGQADVCAWRTLQGWAPVVARHNVFGVRTDLRQRRYLLTRRNGHIAGCRSRTHRRSRFPDPISPRRAGVDATVTLSDDALGAGPAGVRPVSARGEGEAPAAELMIKTIGAGWVPIPTSRHLSRLLAGACQRLRQQDSERRGRRRRPSPRRRWWPCTRNGRPTEAKDRLMAIAERLARRNDGLAPG